MVENEEMLEESQTARTTIDEKTSILYYQFILIGYWKREGGIDLYMR